MQSASPGGYKPSVGASPPVGAQVVNYGAKPVNGGRFDFDDGGTYCGGWEDGKAHGHGVCTGPKGQGEYSGSWHFGFEVSGVYTWPSGSTFEGQWQNGKRHGLGVEYRGRWTYRGEWTQGFKGRYGVRQATASSAKYEGTWANGLQDGYGSETYADGGTFQGQWLRGLRHGYGVRTSAPFGMASHFRPKAPKEGSMTSLKSESAAEPTSERDRRMDDVRGGFVLKARSDEPPARRRSLSERSSNFKDSILKGLKLRKQRSTGDLVDKRGTNSSIRSTGSSTKSSTSWMSNESAVTSHSHHTDSNASFVVEDEQMDASVTETYMGEWKNDRRAGFGISERSDGLKYEGEWYNNKKYGYGVTSFKDGTKEEGKYKNNVLITSQKKKHLFLIRSAKFRERIDAAVNAAQRASKIALQKADIAISRTATARGKAEQSDIASAHSREDSEIARVIAKQFAPDFHQPGIETIKPIVRVPSVQPDLSKLSSQHRPDVPAPTAQQQHQRPQQNFVAAGSRDPYHDENLGPVANPSSTFPSLSRTSVPDRLDRTSIIPNQQLDSMSSQYQYHQQQPPQQQQQPYANRVNEMPTGMYPTPSSGPLRMRSDQNVMDSGAEMPKMNSTFKNSYGGMDTNPSYMDMQGGGGGGPERGRDTVRRSQGGASQMRSQSSSNPQSSANNSYTFQQAIMSDHFDHYKRPPSRDTSVDRFGGGAATRNRSRTRGITPEMQMAGNPPVVNTPYQQQPPSRAQSRARTPFMDNPAATRTASNIALDAFLAMENANIVQPGQRGQTPSRFSGGGSRAGSPGAAFFSDTGSMTGSGKDLEGMRFRGGLGQEIPSMPYTPKRTESLFLKPALLPKGAGATAGPMNAVGVSGGGGGGGGPAHVRKKSLPDAVTLPKTTIGIPREELAQLGSARRQELHRMQDEQERLRANPLLYLLNPNVKNWLSRQKFMILVMLINLALAIMFLQLLT
ncbi:junctophilin-1 isoform X2 [Folsomia candida]|uniref:junctophilin-1 isoform X2 n=1 Tax=Folsomia candida TaxID=158441 RepID=UPI000B8F4386|nr:junctophilin-1 isoform X2 [Folsomia candida]